MQQLISGHKKWGRKWKKRKGDKKICEDFIKNVTWPTHPQYSLEIGILMKDQQFIFNISWEHNKYFKNLQYSYLSFHLWIQKSIST